MPGLELESLTAKLRQKGWLGRILAELISLWMRSTNRLFGVLGPGYTQDGKTRVGYRTALVILIYSLGVFYATGATFGFTGWKALGFSVLDPWTATGSTLMLALFGVQLLISVLTALTFYFDRFRVPVVLIVALAIIAISKVSESDTTFAAVPAEESQVARLETPAQLLAKSKDKLIVIAAAGGGIQSSGWVANVLARLTTENSAFRDHLRVISGVSGGSVGTMFYLASYPGVFNQQAWNMQQVVEAATSSFLEDVAWGLVYPDLHRMILPLPLWGDMDRGRALEIAFGRKAGQNSTDPKPTMLGLAPHIANGLPVVILNSTLTSTALPAVFTNSRFPDPSATEAHKRGIRSFWRDYRLDARLETATRVSATFPYVSPAARPELVPGVDAFVDGGFFDNSGLYSLMAWLEQAAEQPQAAAHEVLLILIDAFPEPNTVVDKRVRLQWYDQVLTPMRTVLRIRETGQAARIKYEFPLFTKSLADRLKVTTVNFRYTPSPRCRMDEPPLSWHLTRMEKDCLAEGWTEEGVHKSRDVVREWLAKPLETAVGGREK